MWAIRISRLIPSFLFLLIRLFCYFDRNLKRIHLACVFFVLFFFFWIKKSFVKKKNLNEKQLIRKLKILLSCLLNHNWEQFFGVQNMHSAVSTALPWNGVSCSMRRNLVFCKQSEKPHTYLSVAQDRICCKAISWIYKYIYRPAKKSGRKNIYLKIDQQLFNFLQWIS